jgi:dienelactone hydrolase
MEKRPSFIRRGKEAVGNYLRGVWTAVNPGQASLHGAAAAVLIAGSLVFVYFVLSMAQGPLLYNIPASLAMLLIGGLLLFLGQGIAWAIGLLAGIPWRYRWALFAAAALIVQANFSLHWQPLVVIVAVLLIPASLLGVALWLLLRRRAELNRARGAAALFASTLSVVGLSAALLWYAAWNGMDAQPVVDAAALSSGAPARLNLPDPSQPGPYPVRTLTYGSGTDRYRAEFGAQAEIVTTPVDGSRLLAGSWQGIFGQMRTLAWGFDLAQLPLNGRVWYPQGEGPFPLVLMVHGNHNMMDFSDPGYAYLGELLASRGYIFASVDQNFLNGGVVDLTQGFSGENDARGWLLLEHLRVWHSWNRDLNNPFYQLVDTGNIAVGGHSRGGEAAAIAAAFNRLSYYPDNFAQSFDYNYHIRAVVAIAPIDGQYRPANRGTPLRNVNYFILHGSHDADVISLSGINQYARLEFDPDSDWFKSTVYIYRANHGQFNTVWGDTDLPGTRAGFLNRAALLPEEDQRQIARVYISAFLDSSLKGERGYLPLFQDARAAGEGWLPDTVYVQRFDQAGDVVLAGYEEDIDLTTTTLPGGLISAEELLNWREQRIHNKWGTTDIAAVYLNWRDGSIPALYTIRLPGEDILSLSGEETLIFHLADPNQDPASENPPVERAPRQPLDFTILLRDSSGETARLPLSQYRMVQSQLPAQLFKAGLFEKNPSSEPVLQSFAIPLADFTAANPAFDPARLTAVSFVFDRTRPGSLIIESVGFRP